MTTSFGPQTFAKPTNVPQTFPELLALYKEKVRDSQLDLSAEFDYTTRPGMEMRKNGAIQALPGLRVELNRLVEQNSAAIFLTGSAKGIESFIGVAQDLTDGNIVVVSAKGLYQRLATEAAKGLRQDRRFSMDTMNYFVGAIVKLLDELNINDPISAPNLVPCLNQVFADTDSLAAVLKTALNATKTSGNVPTGDGLNSLYLQAAATEEAIKEDVATDFLPVIVVDATPEETKGHLGSLLYYGRNVAYEAKDDETTEAVVKSVFKQMKTQYKGRGVRPVTK